MTERTITITVNPIKVKPAKRAPAITCFHIVLEMPGAFWEETFGCVDEARSFIRGIQASASFGILGRVKTPPVSTFDTDPEVVEYSWEDVGTGREGARDG